MSAPPDAPTAGPAPARALGDALGTHPGLALGDAAAAGAAAAAADAPVVAARRDPALSARVLGTRPLLYAAGADPALDRPAHVRAGSGLAWVPTPAGPRLAVVQDDASWVALVDPATALAEAVALPAGVGGRRLFEAGRGNKAYKLDLEACLVVPDPAGGAPVLLGFGSGATAARERVAVVRGLGTRAPNEAEVMLADASALYVALRAHPDFAGAELNLEGAALVRTSPDAPAPDAVRLFARGNGLGNAVAGAVAAGVAAEAGAAATPATSSDATSAACDVPLGALLAYLLGDGPAPAPARVTRYDLGALGPAPADRLGFTDATAYPDAHAGGVLYLAAAEATVDVLEDGPVAGSAVGLLAPDGSARWAPLVGRAGEPFPYKAEGVAAAGPGRLWVVLDVDDPAAPSVLCEVALDGAAWAADAPAAARAG